MIHPQIHPKAAAKHDPGRGPDFIRFKSGLAELVHRVQRETLGFC